jgi:hypothetical protein
MAFGRDRVGQGMKEGRRADHMVQIGEGMGEHRWRMAQVGEDMVEVHLRVAEHHQSYCSLYSTLKDRE